MSPQMTEQDKALVAAHLSEYARLSGEMHATLQRQQQQINTMVILASGIVTLLIPNDFLIVREDYNILPLIPIPFLILAALHLRDDLKLIKLEEYMYTFIRPRIVDLTRASNLDVWRFAHFANRIKFGSESKEPLFYFLLSLLRYAVPFVCALVPLMIYVFSVQPSSWSFIIALDFLGLIFVFAIGFHVIHQTGKFFAES